MSAVFLGLFLVVVNVGVGRGDGGSNRPSWVDRLGRILDSSPRALTTSDLTGACVQEDVLVLSDPCQLTARRASRSREADLVLTTGASATITVTQPDTVDIKVDLTPGRRERISVFRKGAELQIVCANQDSCSIDLLDPKG